ncbi:23S rRNA (pseudouridine(1915)-N(3))-methyltransferase RlmH [Desulfofustis limnaeus]|jgi:23S rRNA (pseudouridine1915-N3)-methyltransferase|uniref:Ribosomal RNA large subunit methyltransferase H n=1 Tax=Desulfofustis limnaeus TaxID=2740163 RepID=A0ABM7W862_9BACT|nr:23S rRNA (pseudouridine(1915)-N(3))-methyltransferase RlmH [Desulfofustis limnaeus]MDX9894761.1 23S rRNA (pseudouridine(1915)-N(3))-methyltransferase RlmH [Desulfofustis sp.]BDD87101.1 ribosomal RNA large subunit methyltransferase H [Desulfofustis limnaeus]
MKIELLLLGKTKESYIEAGIKDFSKRLRHFVPLELVHLKEKRYTNRSDHEIMALQSAVFNQAIGPDSYRVVLDRTGRAMDSEELAVLIGSLMDRGVKKAVFIIGGPLGVAPEQLAAADLVLSLSRMTFTHDLARLLLLEQLYRAFSIRAGTKYHK